MLNFKVLTTLKPSFPAKKFVTSVSEKCNIGETRKQWNHCIKLLNINSKYWGMVTFKDNDKFNKEALEEFYRFYEKPLK